MPSAFKIKQWLPAVYIVAFHFHHAIKIHICKEYIQTKNTKERSKRFEAELSLLDGIAKRWFSDNTRLVDNR